ncbi:hypothetical protein [Ruegeria sp.]|uniref:hypothetical protein n=1 Tax=Ruegeria sp. TaxID=1879320 RepID=UPI003B00834B
MSQRRFMDVVNWDAMVAPGVLLNKDGSYLAGWDVGGIDSDSIPPGDVQALRVQIATCLTHLGDAHTLWIIWQRRPRRTGQLVMETGRMALDILADETNALFSAPGLVWQDRLSLYLGWQPRERASLSAELQGFDDERASLESWLDPILSLSRIDPAGTGSVQNCDLVAHLAALLGEDRPAPRLDMAGPPVGLDALLAPDLIQHRAGGPVQIGDRPLAVMSLAGEREAYHPAPLDNLLNLDLPLIWITRHRATSRQTALTKTAWKQKTWSQSGANMLSNIEGSGTGKRSLFADRMAARVEETQAGIESGTAGYGDYLSTLLLYGEHSTDQGALRRDLQKIREPVQLAGFTLTVERTGAVPVLLSALPGHATPTTRDAMVRCQVTADLSPLRGLWAGSPTCPSPLLPEGTPPLLPALMRSGELFHLNLHVGDVGHTLLFGPTGTGKSVLLGQIAAAWLRYPEAQVIVFDKGRSIRHACAALGGTFLEPGSGGDTGIAPLSRARDLGEGWALDWLNTLVKRGLKKALDTEQDADLSSAVKQIMATDTLTLRALADQVQNKELRRVLRIWLDGAHAGTFDHQRLDVAEGLDRAALTVFETGTLFEANDDIEYLSLDYIFREVDHRLQGRPTLVIIDEAWRFFRHEGFVERIRSWLKEGRKMNLALVMATQSVSDAARSDLTAELLESCPTHLYLANPTASTEENAKLYRSIGLDRTGISTVAGLRLKREMLMVQDQVSRVLALPLGPIGLSLLGRTSKADSARAMACAARNPDYWMEDLSDETIVRSAYQ